MRKLSGFKEHVLLVVIGVVLFWGLFNYDKIFHLLGKGVNILSPLIIGAIIGLIMNVPMSSIERTFFKPDKNNKYSKIKAKIKRPISLLLTFLICLGVVAMVLYLIIPELISTFIQLSEDVPIFAKKIMVQVQNSEQINSWLNTMNLNKDDITKKLTTWLNDGVLVLDTLTSTMSVASSLISKLIDFVLGIVFALYMLYQKEKLKKQVYKITRAIFPEKLAKRFSHIANMAKQTFSKFLSGQCTEAIILGSLCCIGMSILRFPNAVTIGILVAVTAFIPIVGAFVGVAVGAFLIMVTDFKQALWFILFMIILQQIEGNLIYPKVVGQSVGLPSLWVLFAITVGGSMGGIVGMFVAVPICSVLYCLIREGVEYLHKKKGISIENSPAVEIVNEPSISVDVKPKPTFVESQVNVVSHKEIVEDKLVEEKPKTVSSVTKNYPAKKARRKK